MDANSTMTYWAEKGGVSSDVFGPEPGTVPLMRALKARFDPGRLLAPGRFLGRL